MSVPISTEKRMLTEAEFEAVERTHYPAICDLAKDDLADAARRLRDYRDKARDTARRQRREIRGKAAPRGAKPARDDTGTAIKAQIFTGALRRVNKELRRFEHAESRPGDQGEAARRALDLKRANRVRHHPGAGRTPRRSMQPSPNPVPPSDSDPRESAGPRGS